MEEEKKKEKCWDDDEKNSNLKIRWFLDHFLSHVMRLNGPNPRAIGAR